MIRTFFGFFLIAVTLSLAFGEESRIKVLSQGPLYANYDKEKPVAVLIKFETTDVSRLEENKLQAEKLLPEAIRYAESLKVEIIGIQAVQVKTKLGVFTSAEHYGYVWNKNQKGQWEFKPSGKKPS